jgi:CO/xanthine dehydrogenase FAD-binding subunit
MPVEPPVTSPRTLAEAYAAMRVEPGTTDDAAASVVRPIAGGTDLMVALTGELGPPPDRIVDLWAVDALRGITVDDGSLVLGALTTYAEIRRSALVREHLPILVEAAATIGAAQIQERGTLGGNIANASPAGDTLPVLLAADAVMELGSARGTRSVPATAFWTGYRQTPLAPDELVERIRVPLPPGRVMRFRKVGTRRAQSISKVVLASARQTDEGGRWHDVRIALGSVAATPIRASRTEAVLEGSVLTPELADRAAATLAAELDPIDDVRSTAAYRRVVAARILHRMLGEAGGW